MSCVVGAGSRVLCVVVVCCVSFFVCYLLCVVCWVLCLMCVVCVFVLHGAMYGLAMWVAMVCCREYLCICITRARCRWCGCYGYVCGVPLCCCECNV